MRQVSVLLMLQNGCGGWARESYDCLWFDEMTVPAVVAVQRLNSNSTLLRHFAIDQKDSKTMLAFQKFGPTISDLPLATISSSN